MTRTLQMTDSRFGRIATMEESARRPQFGWTDIHHWYDKPFIDYVEGRVRWSTSRMEDSD